MGDVYQAQLLSLARAVEAAEEAAEEDPDRQAPSPSQATSPHALVSMEASMPKGVKATDKLSWFSPTGTLVHLDVGGAHAYPGEFLEFSIPERLLKEPEHEWQEFALMAFDVPTTWTEDRGLATTLPSGVRARIIPPTGTAPGDQLVFCVARWQLNNAGAPKQDDTTEPTAIETRAVLNRLLVEARRMGAETKQASDALHGTAGGSNQAPQGVSAPGAQPTVAKPKTRSLSFKRMFNKRTGEKPKC